VDFVSIGTNDLAQYTMAADRLAPELADLTDPWQPAVLRQIAAVAAAGRRAGTPVGVCGESAGRPDYAPVLVGLGVTSLSMSPRLIPAVGAALASVDFDTCRRAADAATASATAAAARAGAEQVVTSAARP
jgi:phosphotransferase system enzyme I (PtsI)